MPDSILVVDDDFSIGKIISHYLPKNKILYYKSGEEALTYLKNSNGISHGFVDLNLPGIHGKELIREIRNLNNKIKLYIITAYYTSYPPSTCVDCGADGYIAKPLKREIIQAVINNNIDKYIDDLLRAVPDKKIDLNDEINEEWCENNYATNMWEEARSEWETIRDSEYIPPTEKLLLESEEIK